MRRLLPDRLAARFALLLAAALIAANLAALGLLGMERGRLEGRAREEAALAGLLAVAPLMDGAWPDERARLAASLAARGARVEVGTEPLVSEGLAGPDERRLLARLEGTLGGREMRLADGPGPGALAASVALKAPPGWLNAVLRAGPPRRLAGPGAALLGLALSLVAVMAVGLAFTRQLTRPLAGLAEAARAAGRGDRAARVPEAGAREVREAAAAFNEMQARIAREGAERARVVAALGHDLRTPIASLRIRAETLEEMAAEVGAPAARAEARAMTATLEEMGVMAEGLLSFARGRGEDEAACDVDLAALLRRLCAERGAEAGPMDSVTLRARPVALARAAGNLIDNALRYGGAATVSLAREGVEAVVAVEDAGPGIPPERLRDVVEPFVRGEASRGADTGGAGLGLSIARAVAEAHDGALTLANRPGGGLRAEIRLPLEDEG